ncbi:MAG: hypothetical protein U1E96_08970 [Azonexus sp.]
MKDGCPVVGGETKERASRDTAIAGAELMNGRAPLPLSGKAVRTNLNAVREKAIANRVAEHSSFDQGPPIRDGNGAFLGQATVLAHGSAQPCDHLEDSTFGQCRPARAVWTGAGGEAVLSRFDQVFANLTEYGGHPGV